MEVIEVWEIVMPDILKESKDKAQCVKMSPVMSFCYQNDS